MSNIQTPLITLPGLIEGVVTGITIAFILGLYGWVKWRLTRRKQLHHLKQVIIHAHRVIVEQSGRYDESQVLNSDVFRYRYFTMTLEHLDDALKYQASALAPKQVHDVKMILIHIHSLIEAKYLGPIGDRISPSTQFYENELFQPLKDLKWLGLSGYRF